MKAFIRVLKDIALMLTRIIMGVIMVTHGWHRWQNEGITAEANILEHAGIPNPTHPQPPAGSVIRERVLRADIGHNPR